MQVWVYHRYALLVRMSIHTNKKKSMCTSLLIGMPTKKKPYASSYVNDGMSIHTKKKSYASLGVSSSCPTC